MEEKNTTKRREWVKNAAIIFLTIMLLLTFFSNTIMNYSLPEVATQYVQTGTITAKVRGTGKIEASDPYNVIAKESRVITSVAVKQGDTVEKDQVIYYLEDAESDELTQAEKELEDLELNYMKGLFGANVSPEVITKVANGNIDSFSQLQAKVTDMQNRLDAAKKRVDECQKNVDDLTLQSTKDTNNAGVSTKNDELNRDLATTDLTEAQNRFEKDKAATIANLNAQITELTSQISDLEKLLSNAEASAGSGTTTGSGNNTSTSSSTSYDGQRKKAIESLKQTVNVILKGLSKPELGDVGLTEIENAYNGVYNDIKDNKDYQTLIADYNATHMLIDNIEQNAKDVNNLYANNQTLLSSKKAELANLQKQLAEVQAITASSDGGVQDAQNRLNQANRNILEITTANSQTSVAWQNRLADANAALKNAQAVYDLLKEEQTSLAADINAELDLSKTNKDIQAKRAEIENLKEKSMGSAVKAPVAGTISSVKYVAGETTKPEDVMAVIQPEGKGFTLSISVTNEQAKKVQIGDMAELQNSWYYDDARVMLSAIKPDPDKPGTNKLLVFDVSGSTIEADQSLSISVGQRSQEYELVVPNSAIREDNDGKFILTVESKSSPLGNRYIATRVGVEVLASDDNNSAISAPLYGYEYVITTSTKPVEAGKQVRLANNS
ncbi:MAG: HlyD family efflux transporter periplasmic adaptor subunit [Lachnospiraceae bacterium]|nr:HlyD family efflux transporter periplasmic adaptor subunit [Lachnospiraceae bacterium]